MTALTIVQNAANRIKIAQPSAVFSATDDQTVLLRTLMNQEGAELARGGPSDHQWTALIAEKTFTSVAAAIQTSAVPADFQSYINDSMWNRTSRLRVTGPMTPQEWQYNQAISTGTIYPMFRWRGGDILIYPTPTAGDTIAYEYVSKNWAEDSGGTGAAVMTQDTDTSLLDEELITQGIVWRFKQSKGLDYAEDFRTYQINVLRAISKDGGRRVQSIAKNAQALTLPANIPEGSWGV